MTSSFCAFRPLLEIDRDIWQDKDSAFGFIFHSMNFPEHLRPLFFYNRAKNQIWLATGLTGPMVAKLAATKAAFIVPRSLELFG